MLVSTACARPAESRNNLISLRYSSQTILAVVDGLYGTQRSFHLSSQIADSFYLPARASPPADFCRARSDPPPSLLQVCRATCPNQGRALHFLLQKPKHPF